MGFSWEVAYGRRKTNVALLVSRYQHCLVDLLYRHQIGELNCNISMVIGNHEDARSLAEFYGLAFHYIPVTAANKEEAERKQMDLLQWNNVELIVLARYMQVLFPSS